MDDTLKTLVKHIEGRKNDYIERLREAVEIRSVSGWPDHRDDVVKMVKWTAQHLRYQQFGARDTETDTKHKAQSELGYNRTPQFKNGRQEIKNSCR